MDKKTIVFASYRPGFAVSLGGSEIMLRDHMLFFTQQGFSCILLGFIGNISKELVLRYLQGYSMKYVVHDKYIEYISEKKDFGKGLIFFNKTDYNDFMIENLKQNKWNVIITQYEGADTIAKIVKEYNARLYLYVQDWDLKITIANVQYYVENKMPILSLSQFIKKQIFNEYNYESYVMYPRINYELYKTQKLSPEMITYVTPRPKKGVDVFIHTAQALPHRKFLVVDGWKRMNDISSEHEKALNSMPHVQFIPPVEDMSRVYSKTELLLVPSQWNEAFGRVVLEAQINGIPVIASNKGGLPEAVGNGGILIEDFSNPDRWVEKIEFVLNNKDVYQQLSTNAMEHARHFSITEKDSQLLTILGLNR